MSNVWWEWGEGKWEEERVVLTGPLFLFWGGHPWHCLVSTVVSGVTLEELGGTRRGARIKPKLALCKASTLPSLFSPWPLADLWTSAAFTQDISLCNETFCYLPTAHFVDHCHVMSKLAMFLREYLLQWTKLSNFFLRNVLDNEFFNVFVSCLVILFFFKKTISCLLSMITIPIPTDLQKIPSFIWVCLIGVIQFSSSFIYPTYFHYFDTYIGRFGAFQQDSVIELFHSDHSCLEQTQITALMSLICLWSASLLQCIGPSSLHVSMFSG